MTAAADPFWNFSLRVYALPGVADTCLALQDERGLDVNLLLLGLWSGLEGPGVLDTATLGRCLAAVHDWQRQVVQPLRRIRRRLKAGVTGMAEADCQPVRDGVGTLELAAEQAEQRVLAGLLAGLPARDPGLDGRACAASNLERYVELAGVPLDAITRSRLASLLAAAAPSS